MALAGFFDPQTALHDFLRELATRGDPRYPSHAWRCALEAAEERDTMRKVRARNDELWPNGHSVTPLYSDEGDDDPHRLIFLGLAVRMRDPPAQEIEQMHEARSNATDVIYRLKHNAERSTYNREYRRKNREKFLAWQRDYRTANAERLNANKRAKRRAAASASSLPAGRQSE